MGLLHNCLVTGFSLLRCARLEHLYANSSITFQKKKLPHKFFESWCNGTWAKYSMRCLHRGLNHFHSHCRLKSLENWQGYLQSHRWHLRQVASKAANPNKQCTCKGSTRMCTWRRSATRLLLSTVCFAGTRHTKYTCPSSIYEHITYYLYFWYN